MRHTSCAPGKRVRLVYRDGTVVDGRFVERTSRDILLNGDRRMPVRGLRTMIVVKAVR